MPSTAVSSAQSLRLGAILDLAIAVPSFLAFKLTKLVIGLLYSIYLGGNRKLACQWRSLSADTLRSPLSLPVLMTKGPRWNTHAVIGTVGPFRVEQSLALDAEAIARSAGSWTAAIYSYPLYRTVANLGSLEQIQAHASDADANGSHDGSSSSPWHSIELPPGRYSIGLRYYQCADSMSFPTVRVDGAELIPSQGVSARVNDFYASLAQRSHWGYRFLHSYVFTVLTWRHWLPEEFVRREFLPVGAPETEFFYGAIHQGDRLSLSLAPPLVEQFDVYLTVYNRASFPLFWHKIERETYRSDPTPVDGFYLFRVRPKTPEAKHFAREWLRIDRAPVPPREDIASIAP